MTDTPAAPEKLDRYDALILAGFALVKIAVHLCTVLPYGMFRDEFYYLDCANHLDWAYVDQPSLSIFLLAAMRAVFGDGLLAVRLPVILAGAGTVVMAGLIAREMGGNRFARFLACLLALISPIVLAMSSFYSMNAFDLLFWAVGAWLLARIFRTGDGRLWPWFGLVAGFGIENKWSMGFFGAALVVALALTEHRKFFRDPRLWIGGAIALALFVPNLVWQATHQFATFEFMRNAAMGKNAANTPWSYAAGQLLLMHPLNAILAVAGLFYGVVLLLRRQPREDLLHRADVFDPVCVGRMLVRADDRIAPALAPAGRRGARCRRSRHLALRRAHAAGEPVCKIPGGAGH
jgi:4-amino-4-deoxy-L-arabinose transferase-like glycosyltransferase